jgi:hypothetical protein
MSENPDQASGQEHNGPALRSATQQQEVHKSSEQPAQGAARKPLERIGGALKQPAAGATIAGAVVLGAASLFGPAETLLGAGAAYAVYLVAKRRRHSR